jgi:8-oxo-dGTP diphosphatase
MIEITTERLVLKKLKQGDKQSLVSEIGEWEVVKWLSRVPYPYEENDAERWLTITTEQELLLNIFENNVLIGGIGLTENNDDSYGLGYWLGKQHWGKGLATESSKCFLDYAVNELNLTNIRASHMVGNDVSAKVLKKLGFKVVGASKIYCLARQETVSCVELVIEAIESV